MFFLAMLRTPAEPDSGVDSTQSIRAQSVCVSVCRLGFRQICLGWLCYTTSLVHAAVFFCWLCSFSPKIRRRAFGLQLGTMSAKSSQRCWCLGVICIV